MVKSKGIVFHINKKVFDYDKFAEYLNEKSEKITEVLNNDEKNLPFHFTEVFSEVYQLDQDEDYKHVYLVKKRVSSLVPSIEDTVAELYNKELRFNEQDILEGTGCISLWDMAKDGILDLLQFSYIVECKEDNNGNQEPITSFTNIKAARADMLSREVKDDAVFKTIVARGVK